MALTTQQKLDAAQQAYHDLMVGESAKVIVDMNGERVEFTPANAARLQAYIQSLTQELTGTPTYTGPMNVYF